MILDQARLVSDDIILNEEHALFLAKEVRSALLVQKYKTAKLEVADANYQVICTPLEVVTGSLEQKILCSDGTLVRSTSKLPKLLNIGNDMVTPVNYLSGANISLIPIERMRFVGYNKMLRNIIYAAIGYDNYLYMKAQNPQFKYLQQVKVTGVFEDIDEASQLVCDGECDIMDSIFPIEEALVDALIKRCVEQLSGASMRPADVKNTASDDTTEPIAKK